MFYTHHLSLWLVSYTDGTWFNQAIPITKTWTVSSQWRKHSALGLIGSKHTSTEAEPKSSSSPFPQHTTSNTTQLSHLTQSCTLLERNVLTSLSWLTSPSDWAASSSSRSKNCYGETEPITGAAYPVSTYTDQIRSVMVEVLRGMHNPALLLDITLLSSLRKDGHPSVYSGLVSGSQRSRPDQSADCSHWCLPGLPDTWNQLLYTILFY